MASINNSSSDEDDQDEFDMKAEEIDPELDPESPLFNPLKALYSKEFKAYLDIPEDKCKKENISEASHEETFDHGTIKKEQTLDTSESKDTVVKIESPASIKKELSSTKMVSVSKDISASETTSKQDPFSIVKKELTKVKEEVNRIPHEENQTIKKHLVLQDIHDRMLKNASDSDEEVPDKSKPRKKRKNRNILSNMSEMTGPLALLRCCVEEKLLVRVMTRQAKLSRSILKGYVVAFDKFMNMAMIDVDEIYRRPKILGKVRSRISHKLQAAQPALLKERAAMRAALAPLPITTAPTTGARAVQALPGFKDLSYLSTTDLKQILESANKCSLSESEPKATSSENVSSSSTMNIKQTESTLQLSHNIKQTESSLILSQNNIKQTDSSVKLDLHKIKQTESSVKLELHKIKQTESSINLEPKSIKQTESSLQLSQQKIKQSPSSATLVNKNKSKDLLENFKTMLSLYPGSPAALSPFEREALMLGVADENVNIRHMNQLFVHGSNVVSVNIVPDVQL